jgi:hypothetical protein
LSSSDILLLAAPPFVVALSLAFAWGHDDAEAKRDTGGVRGFPADGTV